MILNQRQLGISRKKLADLRTYQDQVAKRSGEVAALELESITEVIADVEAEIKAYKGLFNSHPERIDVASLDAFPLAIIQARIASGLTHKELADRLSLTESAIQRYEQQRYRGASFERLCEVINAIGIPVMIQHNPLTAV